MAEVNRADGKYHDTEFYVNQYWQFCVPELDRVFADYETMTTAIDNKAKELEAARREKMSIACITKDGKKVTLTGIHAGHGGFLTTPKIEKFSNDTVLYPDCSLVASAMLFRDGLENQLERANAALKLLAVNNFDSGWGSHKQQLVHATEVSRVKKELAAIVKRCEQLGTVEALLGEVKDAGKSKQRIRL